MKKPLLALASHFLLMLVLVAPVHASVSVESTIGGNIYIVYNLENLDETIYNETMANDQFNSSTIPQILVKNLEMQNLARVSYDFQPNSYDNATNTIRVSFYLGGSDIISYTLNRTTMRRIYQVRTEWRKFQVNLTSSFSIDFAQYFAEPVANWKPTNYTTSEGSTHPAYYFETTNTGFLDTLSFTLILSPTATNIQAQGDTITYEVPPYFEDVFLNSPFLILVVLMVVIIVVLIYRRVR